MSKTKKYFGTDGVRGQVGEALMSPDFLVRLGFAIGRTLGLDQQGKPQVLIGKDTRLSGYMVESALEAGLAAAGVDVLLTGPIPTSAVAYLTQTLRLSAGIVITASHNPYHDNGVKIFGGDGCKISTAMQDKIENAINDKPMQFNHQTGKAERLETAADRYIEFCKRTFPNHLNLKGMRVLVDCAHGSAYYVAPALLHELGAEVVVHGVQPDGLNINVDAGVMAPQQAIDKLQAERCDIGVVLDGDADRVNIIDEKGHYHDGDAVLHVIVESLRRRNKVVKGVVGTVLSNSALQNAIEQMGVAFSRSAVGDRHIFQAMLEQQFPIGGEPSGHIIMHKFHQTGDGIIAALQVMRAMGDCGVSLSELLKNYQPIPHTTKDILVSDAKAIMADKTTQNSIETVQSQLPAGMRLVVRASGTENKIRVLVEGHDRPAADATIATIEKAIINVT